MTALRIIFLGTAELSCAVSRRWRAMQNFKSLLSSRNRPPQRPRSQTATITRQIARTAAGSARVATRTRPRRTIHRRTQRLAARPHRCCRLRTDFAAGDPGFAVPWLFERAHVAAANISRCGADSMGHCQRRHRNRRHHHEMDVGLDTGDIIATRRTTISAWGQIPPRCTTGWRNSVPELLAPNHSRLCRRENPAASAARRRRKLRGKKSKKKTAALIGTGRAKPSGTGCALSRRGPARSRFLPKRWRELLRQ